MFTTEYFADRISRGELSEWSAKASRDTVLQWCRFAKDWTPDEAARWVHDQTIRPNTRKNRLSRLRPYIRWLVTHGHLDTDITLSVPRVRVPRGAPRDLPVDGVRRLLTACPDDRARVIVLLMVHCGLRAVDVSRIRVDDLDASRHTLDVRGKGGRGEVTHTIPVPVECWNATVDYLVAGSGPLVRHSRIPGRGISAQHVSILVRRWIADAGLKAFPGDGIGAHSLRHSCAQHLLDDGAQIRQVQAILGHQNQSTTELYLRHDPPGLREAVEGRSYLNAA